MKKYLSILSAVAVAAAMVACEKDGNGDENKVDVKQAATVIKITDAAAVQAAKDSIDIVVKTINDEKEYKKQQAKERRKAARLAKAAEKAE